MIEFQFVFVRTCCDLCGIYGKCAVAQGFDGREVYIGVKCGCLERDMKDLKKLRKEGSPHVAYA